MTWDDARLNTMQIGAFALRMWDYLFLSNSEGSNNQLKKILLKRVLYY
jgi:hypothetical protein